MFLTHRYRYRLIRLFLLLWHQTGAVLGIFTSSQRALAGSDVLLPCSFQVDKPPPNPEPPTVIWYFEHQEIVRSDNKVLPLSPRASFSGQAANMGDASLSLANVSISDEGIYKCHVIYQQQPRDTRVILEVLVPPQIHIPSKVISKNKENTLICTANGFYPEDIDMSWYKDNKHLTESQLDKPERNPDGTYRVRGTVTLPPMDGQMDHNFSCRVQHHSLQQPLQEDAQLEFEDNSAGPVTVACGIAGGLLLVGGVIGAVIWKQRRKATFSLKPIVGPDTLTIGEETKLQCIGTNCPSDVQVTWSVRGGSDGEIVLHQSGEDKATESLLSQYVVHSETEGNNHITTLTFTLDKHTGATFGCKFVGGGKVKEKHFHTKTIQAKPKVPEPINITFQGSHNLDLTLKLQRFYPKDIRIKWGCREGTQQPAREEWRENSDLTWDLTSVYSVPKDLFKDPAFRVRVTWKHGSLGGPQSREVSVADFPWRPQLDIKNPTLREREEATLSCRIFGYYPDDLTVQWFRLEKGGNKESPLDPETYRVSRTESQEQEDKTFACDTSVTFTPTIKSDNGAELICRVGHPTQGVEKRSGQLHVYKSQGK